MGDFLINILEEQNSLTHHGILGQKWGIRRFQNLDGSLTSAGRDRYSTNRHFRNMLQITSDTYKLASTLFKATNHLYLNPGSKLSSTQKLIDFGKAYVNDILWKYERNTSKTDSKTGFHMKTRNLTEQEDLARVNPRYKTFNTDKHNNCALCTVTADLRKRGYDVTANPAAYGYRISDYEKWYDGFEEKVYDFSKMRLKESKAPLLSLPEEERQKYTKLIVEAMFEDMISCGEGARGVLGIHWATGGHAVMWEVKNGKVQILDGQTGKIYRTPKEMAQIIRMPVGLEYGRLDNLEPNWDNIKECCS